MKLFSFHTVLFTCKCGCQTIHSDAELAVDPDGEYVEGVDVELHIRLVVRYSDNLSSVVAARGKLCDLLLDEECDSDAAQPVLRNFTEHVTKNLGL